MAVLAIVPNSVVDVPLRRIVVVLIVVAWCSEDVSILKMYGRNECSLVGRNGNSVNVDALAIGCPPTP